MKTILIATLALFTATSARAQVPGPIGTLTQGIPALQSPQPPPPAAAATPNPVGMNVDPPLANSTQTSAQGANQAAQAYQQAMQQQMQQQLQNQQPSSALPPYANQNPSNAGGLTSAPLTPDEIARHAQQQLDAQARSLQPNMVEQTPPRSEIVPVLPPAAKISEVRAVLRTSVGDITIKLDRAAAPETVAYFIGLSRGDQDFVDVKTSKPVKRPFYNGLIFNRVVKNTLIQTGDPFNNGRGDSGKTLKDEIRPSMKFDRPGLVAMSPARDGSNMQLLKDSNSSQFFISLREMPTWNGQFTIFGQVEDGMDVVQKIANVKVGPTERPIKRIYLVAVEIIESNK